jgi:hypothetical protein
VEEADTNGKLFLAFPANRGERNSVKEKSSLLRVLCGTEDDTKCRGSTAPQAEFRSEDGTFPRMIGVVLIAVGVLGMTMLFGLVALRLMSAAIVSLFLLLLAPFAVLAPALGDSGRTAFGGWATRLLGSVVSKLVFSFLLGALLSMQRMLVSLELLGWWTQWLLISAFWWALFFKRHQAMALLQNRGRGSVVASRSTTGRTGGNRESTAIARSAGWAKRKILSPVPSSERLRKGERVARRTVSGRADEQAMRTLDHDHRAARTRMQASPQIQEHLSSMRAQLERVRRARQTALATGDSRRAARLAVREQRVNTKLAREQRLFGEARRTVADDHAMRRVSGSSHTTGYRERGRFLDQQAGLPSSRLPRDGTPRRDYPALAGLAGYGREEYERLAPRARREARLQIDRELVARSHHRVATQEAVSGASQLGSREPGRVDTDFDRALEQRVHVDRTSFRREPNKGSRSSLPESDTLVGNETGWDVAHKVSRPRSTVMDDARAVAERRKRQLGYGPDR